MFVIASGADSCHISVYPSVQFDPAAENRAQAIGIAKTTRAESLPSRRAQLPLQSARLNFSTEASNVDITAADNVRVPAGS
jgi:hypothetical protein